MIATDMELKRRESRYCARRDIEVFIGSWNIDACKPVDLPDARFVEKWVSSAPNGTITQMRTLTSYSGNRCYRLAGNYRFREQKTCGKGSL